MLSIDTFIDRGTDCNITFLNSPIRLLPSAWLISEEKLDVLRCIAVAGMIYAFYVKPMIKRRRASNVYEKIKGAPS